MENKSVDLLMKAKRSLDSQAHTAWTEFHPFRSAAARAEYFAALEKREARWPVQSENRFVQTSWAKTFVRVSGPPDAPPLALLHGSATNSISWEPNIQALSARFRTYAIDNPYDVGRSVYQRDVTNVDEFAEWMDETFSALGLADRFDLAGMSYGGWLTAEYLLRHPERVRKAVLLSPALTVQPVRLIWIIRCLLSMFNRTLSRNFAKWTLYDSYSQGGYPQQLCEEVADDGLALAKKCISRHVVLPKRLTDEEWGRIKTPLLVLAGVNEKHYHPARAIAHMKRVAPHVQFEVIAGAGHDLPLVKAEVVNQKVVAFLAQ